MAVLSDEEVDAAAAQLDGWQRIDGALRRSVTFPSFLDGIEAVRQVAVHAERADHHPDIDIRWRTVTFALVTHSQGGITDQDVQMARELDGILPTRNRDPAERRQRCDDVDQTGPGQVPRSADLPDRGLGETQ